MEYKYYSLRKSATGCPYNEGLYCKNRFCIGAACGWHPLGEMTRKEALHRKRLEEHSKYYFRMMT